MIDYPRGKFGDHRRVQRQTDRHMYIQKHNNRFDYLPHATVAMRQIKIASRISFGISGL